MTKAKKSGRRVEYSSNNSGGRWWLKDGDWEALEKAGWTVQWGSAYFCKSKYESLQGPKPKRLKECKRSEDCPGHYAYKTYAEAKKMPERWLGALATGAVLYDASSLEEAVARWEKATGKSSTDAGCSCCGQPHYFSFYDGDTLVASGPETRYEASW